MQFSIIIVNYKTPNLTLRCVESIIVTVDANIPYEIIVIDNNSQDNSETLVKSKFNNVIWINNSINEGFGRANNIGIKKAKGEYVLLVNSDIVVLPNTIEACLQTIKVDSAIGVLGCNLLNEDGSVQKSQFSIASFTHLLNQNLLVDKFLNLIEPKQKAIMGSFMLIPKKVLNVVGLFDPDFFMYCEELELCNRILKGGYKIEQTREVSVIHAHGASSNQEWSQKQKLLSNALLYFKIHGFIGYSLYHFIWIVNTLINLLFMCFIDNEYQKNLLKERNAYYYNFLKYITVPFLYSKIGKRKSRLLMNDNV